MKEIKDYHVYHVCNEEKECKDPDNHEKCKLSLFVVIGEPSKNFYLANPIELLKKSEIYGSDELKEGKLTPISTLKAESKKYKYCVINNRSPLIPESKIVLSPKKELFLGSNELNKEDKRFIWNANLYAEEKKMKIVLLNTKNKIKETYLAKVILKKLILKNIKKQDEKSQDQVLQDNSDNIVEDGFEKGPFKIQDSILLQYNGDVYKINFEDFTNDICEKITNNPELYLDEEIEKKNESDENNSLTNSKHSEKDDDFVTLRNITEEEMAEISKMEILHRKKNNNYKQEETKILDESSQNKPLILDTTESIKKDIPINNDRRETNQKSKNFRFNTTLPGQILDKITKKVAQKLSLNETIKYLKKLK
jgi:hypothetical protein